MKLLCATVCAVLCFALGGTVHIFNLETETKLGTIKPWIEPPTPEDKEAANHVISLLEYARRLMPVGISHVVNVTEPYTRDELPPVVLNGSEGLLDGVVILSNLVAEGPQTFTIDSIVTSFNASRLDFHFRVPHVVVNVDYEGTNLTLANILVFNTSGHCVITLNGLDIQGAFGTNLEDSPIVNVTGIEVKHKVDDTEPNCPHVNGFVHPVILRQVADAIAKSVVETAWEDLDAILSHFTLEQILTFLEG